MHICQPTPYPYEMHLHPRRPLQSRFRAQFAPPACYLSTHASLPQTPKITFPSHKTALPRTNTLTISHYCYISCNILQSFKNFLQLFAFPNTLTYLCFKLSHMERKNYQTLSAQGQKGRIEQLLQLLQITFDGDLISSEIELLKTYNRWRRGEDLPAPDPVEIGKAIDKLTL